MRYKFYREHKYVSAALNDLERLIAKTDFCQPDEVNTVHATFKDLTEMLEGHANYENDRLHLLLKNKHSSVHEHAEKDHDKQQETLSFIESLINKIKKVPTDEAKISLGYELYLTYRKFVADNLHHLFEEETVILPELQRLYSDEELKQVEAKTYQSMTADEMIEMIKVLFPHMNVDDKKAFLNDIYQIDSQNFNIIWQAISYTFNENERNKLNYVTLTKKRQ